MPVCRENPPCDAAREGACLLTGAAYWLSLVGLSPMLAHVTSPDATGIGWALLTGCGISLLVRGIRAALTHDDRFRLGSFAWSVFVIAITVRALLLWPSPKSISAGITITEFHVVQAVALSWLASNLMNLWLQLRGRFRRYAVTAPSGPPASRSPLLRRSVTLLEEFEEHGIEALPLTRRAVMGMPPRVSPDVIEHHGAPEQIVYVRQPDGSFAEVLLPDALPVNRRVR